jgi:hypothetical protein
MAIQDSHEMTPTFSDSTPEPVGSQSLPTNRRSKLFSNVVTLLLLVTIMATGGYFRFVGQNWDDYTHLHPDERFLTDVASRIAEGNLSVSGVDKQYFGSPEEQNAACFSRYPTTNGDGDFFDSQCSTWYPKNNGGFGLYVYGELPLFTVKIAARLTRWAHERQAAETADPLHDRDLLLILDRQPPVQQMGWATGCGFLRGFRLAYSTLTFLDGGCLHCDAGGHRLVFCSSCGRYRQVA